MRPLKKIICPTDFSEPSKAGLMAAIELAGKYEGVIHMVHALTPLPLLLGNAFVYSSGRESMPFTLDDLELEVKAAMENLIETLIPAHISSTYSILRGRPADEITRLAEEQNADLITIATHGESGWQRFLFGSVAEKVVRQATCPVLTIHRPQE